MSADSVYEYFTSSCKKFGGDLAEGDFAQKGDFGFAIRCAAKSALTMAAGLTSDDPSTLLRFIGIEEDTDLETPLRTVGSIRTMIELLDVGGRLL